MHIVKGSMKVHKSKTKIKLGPHQHAIVLSEVKHKDYPDGLSQVDIYCGSLDGSGTETNTLVYALGDALFDEEVCRTIIKHAHNSQQQAMADITKSERPEKSGLELVNPNESGIIMPERKIIVGGV